MSTLTGESRPVRRHVAARAAGTDIDAPDRVFAGTHVVAGTGEALVTATGMAHRARAHRRADPERRAHASPLELEMVA